MRNVNLSSSRVKVLLVVVMIAALVVPSSLPHWLTPKPRELERILMADGSILVVHAVLTEPNQVYSVSDGGILRSKVIARQRPETGITVVLSCREAGTDRFLSLDWFGRLELKDKHGDIICGWSGGVTQSSGASYQTSSGVGHDPSYSQPLSSGYRLLVVTLPHVDPADPIRFDVVDRDGKKVASFGAPRPFKPTENAAFAAASHSNKFAEGDWELELSEVRAHFSGKLINGAKWDPQSQIYPKLIVEHRGNWLDDNHYAMYNFRILDGQGNVATPGSVFLSRKEPLWKVSFDIARTSYAENFSEAELSLLGKVVVEETLKPVESLVPALLNSDVSSIIYLPEGEHSTQLTYSDADKSGRRFGQSFLQAANNFYSASWSSRDYLNTHSYSGSGTRFSGSHHLTVGAFDLPSVDAFFNVKGIQQKQDFSISSKSSCPLLAVLLTETTQGNVLSIVVKDQDGARLLVHPMQHALPRLPTYAVETREASKSIRVYACLEKLSHVEMYIKPPTAGLNVLNDETKAATYRIAAEKGDWTVVNETVIDLP